MIRLSPIGPSDRIGYDWLNQLVRAVKELQAQGIRHVQPPLGLATGTLFIERMAGSGVRGAIVRERYDVDGNLIPDDDTFRSTFIAHVLAQVCDLGTGLEPGAFVTLKVTASAAEIRQRVLIEPAVPPGWPPATVVDGGFSQIRVDDVVGWLPGDGTESVQRGIVSVEVDGYVVAHVGMNGAIPTTLIQDHFFARLRTNEGGGSYTFQEVLQEGTAREGTASELNGVATLPAGAGALGTAVRICMTWDGAYYFVAREGGAVEVVGGPGISVTEPDPDEWHVAVDLTNDPTHPGLEFVGVDDAGELRVKADGARGLLIDASGVYVKADTARGIDVQADGVRAKPDPARSLNVDATGLYVTTSGVSVYADGVSGVLKVGTDGTAGIGVDDAPAGKGVHVVLAALSGLTFDSGALLADPEGSEIAYAEGENDGWIMIDPVSGQLRHGDPQSTFLDTSLL